MRFSIQAFAFAVCVLFAPQASMAHDYFIYPEQWELYKADQRLPISVISTHYFLKAEELEGIDITTVRYNGQSVPLTTNEAWLSYDGVITLKGGGAAILEGHRLPILWSETPDGGKDGGRKENPQATLVTQYEKFTKVALPVDGNSEGYNAVLGHKLELVPLENPLTAKVGDEIPFRVLLDGKPAMFDMVFATYDGFSDIGNAWAYAAAPVSHGLATVRLSAPGFWSVKVNILGDEKTEDYDGTNLTAIYSFWVK